MMSTTLFLIDDHELFRDGIKTLIAGEADFELLGEAGDYFEALDKLKELDPDILAVDISLPSGSGIDLIREVKKFRPECRILMVSMHNKALYIKKCLEIGISGFVLKESSSKLFLEALKRIARGQTYFDPVLTSNQYGALTASPVDNRGGYNALTSREQEVFRYLAEGFNTREISQKLYISRKTVENHRFNIMHKLNLASKVELVKYAAEVGVIEL